MNKKIIILAGALFLSVQAYSQIGINTPTPSSTVDIRGSVEGNYLEITGDYPLLPTDYHVSFSGTGNSKLTLPSKSATDNSAADFRGRKYYIKNNSTSSTLTLTAASGQILRLGGSITNSNTFGLRPGRSAVLTAGGANGWDMDVDTSTWELYDMDFKGPVFTPVNLGFTAIPDSRVTVTVPSSDAVVLVDFTGFGQGIESGADGMGGVWTYVYQEGGPELGGYGWSGKSWYDYAGNYNPKFNFAVRYSVSGLAPGIYTFYLRMQSVTRGTAGGENLVSQALGSTGRAEVYMP
ncbi:hypothetical protein JET18_07140 [Chryseobacterium sp. L7]|uniref:Uncharacterized protein n=1 Tax=Chryseobacterium endalhagicum TaxID=2797638 RepID=A0ABS1QE67_9FLAO|nr:hypothetical protein [Chryseobacterium endalhagicum]MBL1220607.1 hypothetical protein [Chryseobacterium endalhagicum]